MDLLTRPAVTPRTGLGAHRRAVLVVVCVSALIVNVDNTILNVALPTLVRDLHATSSELQWIVDSYAMVFAGLLLVGGSLADRFGRKRFFLIGLTVFAGGSIGAGLSGSVHLLIACRAIMGAGAAMTIPSSLSIINDIFRDPGERARAIGAWAGTIGLGIAIGPIAGGLLLSRFWWGSIFLVNVPIASPGSSGLSLLVPDSKNPTRERPDPSGRCCRSSGSGLLLWAIIEAPTRGWTSGDRRRRRAGEPRRSRCFRRLGVPQPPSHVASWRSSRDRRFSVAAAAECLGVFGLMGALFLSTQFLQFDLGLLPSAGRRPHPAHRRRAGGERRRCLRSSPGWWGTSSPLPPGWLPIAAGLWQISAVARLATTYGDVVPGLLLLGLGAGLLLPTATNSLVGSVPQSESGVGSASNAVALQVGGALGVAVIGSAMSTRYQHQMTAALGARRLPEAVTHAILGSLGGALSVAGRAGGTTGALLARAARDAFMSGLKVSLGVGALVALAGALLAVAGLPARAAPRPPDASPRA